MNSEAIEWVVNRIHDWRKEAGNTLKIRQESRESLLDALDLIQAAGVEEGLAVYVILGCEWLFRLKKFSGDDINRMLGEIEDGLSEIMERHLAYWVTEAIAPKIRKLLEREGRMLVSFGRLYVPDISLDPSLKALFYPEGYERAPPERISLPTKRGPIPWPAPWIAGCTIAKMLGQEGGEVEPAIEVVSVLLGRPIEPIEFRGVRKTLDVKALTELTELYSKRYIQFLKEIPSKEWWPALRTELNRLKPEMVFPGELKLVQDLLASYRSSPKKAK